MDHNYYLRSKRRKLNDGTNQNTYVRCSQRFKRKNLIMHCPLEVLQHVFDFISFDDLSTKVRLVNRRLKRIAEDCLNRKFRSLEKCIQNLKNKTHLAIQSTKDNMELKILCRMLNLLEIIQFQHSIVMATIWRYVYNNNYKNSKSCMFAGQILDFYQQFLYKFKKEPQKIYSMAVIQDYVATPKEVNYIIRLSKLFCNHFEKIQECRPNYSNNCGGSKIVDLLDCAPFCQKSIKKEVVLNNWLSCQYSYHINNAWFVSFKIPPEGESSKSYYDRLMYMRIRRLVLAHTEMYMQHTQYKREVLTQHEFRIKPPSMAVYTGYGDINEHFFCYGVMNEVALDRKFLNQQENRGGNGTGNETTPKVNPLGIDLDINVECPLINAPWSILQKYDDAHLKRKGTSKFDLKITFPGAIYTRLPTTFTFSNYSKI